MFQALVWLQKLIVGEGGGEKVSPTHFRSYHLGYQTLNPSIYEVK